MACSSSIIGVSTIYPKTPSLDQQLHPKKTNFISLSKLRHNIVSLGGGGSSAFVASAVAARNSVLSEEAFKGLGIFDDGDQQQEYEDELEASIDENENENENDDELAVSKLGLPKRLVETLETRGITKLFPIQVIFPSFIFLQIYLL